MKLPVMLEASGIETIVIDGKICWMRSLYRNFTWCRKFDNGRGYEYKDEEELLSHIRTLIQKRGYSKVWVSGKTINVRRQCYPEKSLTSPDNIVSPPTGVGESMRNLVINHEQRF